MCAGPAGLQARMRVCLTRTASGGMNTLIKLWTVKTAVVVVGFL